MAAGRTDGDSPAVAQAGGTSLHLRLQPRASRSAVNQVAAGRLRISIMAPPVDGAANDALLRFLAKLLRLPPSALELTAGAKGREKTVHVPGLAPEEVLRRLGVGGG